MEDLLSLVNHHYLMEFDRAELLRDSGSLAYAAFSGADTYFLRVVKPSLVDTAMAGTNIQVFLQQQGFPVPPVWLTKKGVPYVIGKDGLVVLYTFIEGKDSQPEQDIETIGALVGRLHREMRDYPGTLINRDRQFYIGRYVDFLREKGYPRAEEYAAYGEELWENIKDLPMGYCHGDMYNGNIRKAVDGKLYIHDFDTSCIGFPMYDAALICNSTEYFHFDERALSQSDRLLERFLSGYERYSHFTLPEIHAFHALIALQHFSTQATIVELFGPDCLSDAGIDGQLDWLYRWREQCRGL